MILQKIVVLPALFLGTKGTEKKKQQPTHTHTRLLSIIHVAHEDNTKKSTSESDKLNVRYHIPGCIGIAKTRARLPPRLDL